MLSNVLFIVGLLFTVPPVNKNAIKNNLASYVSYLSTMYDQQCNEHQSIVPLFSSQPIRYQVVDQQKFINSHNVEEELQRFVCDYWRFRVHDPFVHASMDITINAELQFGEKCDFFMQERADACARIIVVLKSYDQESSAKTIFTVHQSLLFDHTGAIIAINQQARVDEGIICYFDEEFSSKCLALDTYQRPVVFYFWDVNNLNTSDRCYEQYLLKN